MTDRELSALFHRHSEYWKKQSSNTDDQTIKHCYLTIAFAFKKIHEDLMK